MAQAGVSNPVPGGRAPRAAAELCAPGPSAAVAAALEDPDLAVRQAAALGLRLQPNPGAAAALARRLADSDALLARLASDALAAGGAAALPDLRRAAAGPAAGTRIHAGRALRPLK